jgi:hypothetical protein
VPSTGSLPAPRLSAPERDAAPNPSHRVRRCRRHGTATPLLRALARRPPPQNPSSADAWRSGSSRRRGGVAPALAGAARPLRRIRLHRRHLRLLLHPRGTRPPASSSSPISDQSHGSSRPWRDLGQPASAPAQSCASILARFGSSANGSLD